MLDAPFAAGTIIDDRYEVLEFIGAGGMGTVYKTLERDLGRLVAVKLLHHSFASDPEDLMRFEREGHILSSLHHSNIIVLYRFAVWKKQYPYIAMEFVGGKSLRQLLDEEEKLDWQRVLPIACQICQALDHAHSNSVIHRDIKPGNIILANDQVRERVKLVDFGLARLLTSFERIGQQLTSTGALIGTGEYMSPEQCVGTKAGATTDVYALGCVLYECLSGVKPFQAENNIGLLHLHVNQAPVSLSQLVSLPPGLEDVILNALEKESDDRYQSMKEFQTDLLRVAAGDIDDLKRVRKGGHTKFRHKRISVVAGIALVTISSILFSFIASKLNRIDHQVVQTREYSLDAAERLINSGHFTEAHKLLTDVVVHKDQIGDGELITSSDSLRVNLAAKHLAFAREYALRAKALVGQSRTKGAGPQIAQSLLEISWLVNRGIR